MKYILLSCLLLNSAYSIAQSGKPTLNDIMLQKINMPATEENIIYGRDAHGKSIIHIIPELAARAQNATEVCNYAEVQAEITEETLQALKLILEKEGNTVDHHLIRIIQSHPGPQTVANLDIFFKVGKFYKENKRPYVPKHNCYWKEHPIRDGILIAGSMTTALLLQKLFTYMSEISTPI